VGNYRFLHRGVDRLPGGVRFLPFESRLIRGDETNRSTSMSMEESPVRVDHFVFAVEDVKESNNELIIIDWNCTNVGCFATEQAVRQRRPLSGGPLSTRPVPPHWQRFAQTARTCHAGFSFVE